MKNRRLWVLFSSLLFFCAWIQAGTLESGEVSSKWVLKRWWTNKKDRIICRYAVLRNDCSLGQMIAYMYWNHVLFCNALEDIQRPRSLWLSAESVRALGILFDIPSFFKTFGYDLLPPTIFDPAYGGYSDTGKLQTKFRQYAFAVFKALQNPKDRRRQIRYAQRVLEENEKWFTDTRDNLAYYRLRALLVLSGGFSLQALPILYFKFDLGEQLQRVLSRQKVALYPFLATIGGLITTTVGMCISIPYIWRTKHRCAKGLEQVAVLKQELATAITQTAPDFRKENPHPLQANLATAQHAGAQ